MAKAYERGRRHNFMAVVGESFYQDALRQLETELARNGETERLFEAVLTPEPGNQ